MIRKNIKKLRVSKKLTQKQVAEAINVKPESVQRFEYGTIRPSLDTLIALADYFGVSLDYLVGRSEKPEITK
ncbi:transcriptional regulator [Clostridia bacterium]|nr:transcriptional regulator [Clostridia bacterium]